MIRCFTNQFILAPQLKLPERSGSSWIFEGDKYGLVVSQFHFEDVVSQRPPLQSAAGARLIGASRKEPINSDSSSEDPKQAI